LRRAECIGRPLGSEAFIEKLENETKRVLKRKRLLMAAV
jgi:hypothetical protein